MNTNFDDFYGSLDSIDFSELLSPVREELLSLVFTQLSHTSVPTMFVQFGIGMYYGYNAAYEAYHSKSQYKMRSQKKSKVQLITDMIGSPRTSPLSAFAYYLAGSLNNKYRTFFFAKEIYEGIQNPAPLIRKNIISPHKTFIPFCYPDFKYYENTNSPYSRCYQAMYESSFERAHQALQINTEYYYGRDKDGSLLRYTVKISPYGSFNISQEIESTFLGKIKAAFTSHYSLSQLKTKISATGIREGIHLTQRHQSACKKFKVIGYHSEKQASEESKQLQCLQLTLPDDTLCDPMTDFDELLEIIRSDKPQRIVFHQQQSSEIGHQNALVLASKINALRRSSSLGFELNSLAYHGENPKDPIPEENNFYSFFSEVCTMGYNNPQQIIESKEVQESSNIKSQSEELTTDSESDWPQTRVYHIKLQRPPFEWVSVPKTFLAMIIHDMIFEVYGATLQSLKDAAHSGRIFDIVKLIGFIGISIFSSAKFVIQLSLLPLRLVFSLSAAGYLYYSGQNNNLFEIGPEKNFKAALKIDDFSQKTAVEKNITYTQPLLNFSQALEKPSIKLEPKVSKKKKKKSKKHPKPTESTTLLPIVAEHNQKPAIHFSHNIETPPADKKIASSKKKRKKKTSKKSQLRPEISTKF